MALGAFRYTEQFYYTISVNAKSRPFMHKYFIKRLAVLRIDETLPPWYSIVTERKQPEIRNPTSSKRAKGKLQKPIVTVSKEQSRFPKL